MPLVDLAKTMHSDDEGPHSCINLTNIGNELHCYSDEFANCLSYINNGEHEYMNNPPPPKLSFWYRAGGIDKPSEVLSEIVPGVV